MYIRKNYKARYLKVLQFNKRNVGLYEIKSESEFKVFLISFFRNFTFG